ncbi:MAG TPA: FAD-binding oxidoreductase [Terriglobia bacterium]|nr:FAD-binding oxidoreductase [Terriglobia bacterium]
MPTLAYAHENLAGWGRFPVEPCHLYRPEKQAELSAILQSTREPSYIPRGLGRSYGDAALNLDAAALCSVRLNRFLLFDRDTGILECECGASLAEIIDSFLPRGFFLPVTPGTKFVTLGGAIAADVHGKNHHRDGTIANFIRDFRLLTPAGEVLTCSPTDHGEIFWATVGGMGLTGVILSARIALRRVESAYLLVDYEKARNLQEALERMAASDENYQYSVAWIDCLARGGSLGRSVLMRANHAAAADLPSKVQEPLRVPHRSHFNIPVDLPALALNSHSVGAFNHFYYARHRTVQHQLVDADTFFYPLDSIRNWNRLYGKRGFVQYQVVFPTETTGDGLAVVLKRLAQSRRASFLAVLKRFGDANRGLLSFPIKGHTLSLDLPMARDLPAFLQRLDEVVATCGGRVYLAKDAVSRPETFAATYPQAEQFRAIKQKLDPKGLFSSSLARRLRIVNG